MISKKALVIGFVGLVFVVGGASTVLESFGTISGTADVERSVELHEINYNSPVEGEESGEYVVLKVNTDSIDLSNWNLTTDDTSDNINNVTASSSDEFIALVDNKTVVRNSTDELDTAGVKVYDVGDIGLSNSDGNAGSGENISISYILESNALVHKIDYSLSSCGDTESYNVSEESCDSALLEVSAK